MVKWFVFMSCVFVSCLAVLSSCGQVKFSGGSDPSQNPPVIPPVTPSGQPREVTFSTKVTPPNNMLDILLVIDDSNSMLPDNQKLAQKMATFVTELGASSIDWQMCVTVTRALTVENALTWGASVFWSEYSPAAGDGWILKPTANLSTVFSKTIDNIGAGWAGTDDERGIKAAWSHFSRSATNKCYRPDSAIAVIMISDEDERSVGGIKALEYYADESKLLEDEDKPESLIAQVKKVFGESKRFTFNSIIVKPEDSACMTEQDASGAKSHYGKSYSSMSTLTGGGIGSICAADFSTNLNLFKGIIQETMGSFPLECIPIDTVTTTIEPAFTTTQTIDGPKINFEPKIPAGRQLTLKYKCAK